MRVTDIRELAATKGKLLGVDYGDVRTGLAVSDITRFLAGGTQTVAPGSMSKTAAAVAEAAASAGCVGIIIGLPVNMNGSEGGRADHIRLFADMVEAALPQIPVFLMDERMTTMAASRFLNETNTHGKKRKAVIDTLSAQIILQNALDRLKNIQERGGI